MHRINEVPISESEKHCGFYNPAMRSCLLIILMALMPLSSAWAALSRYCQHEASATVGHFGHHGHQHPTVNQTESNTDQSITMATDLDCGTCHSGCSMAIQDPGGIDQSEASQTFASSSRVQPELAPMARPDRPQWPALA